MKFADQQNFYYAIIEQKNMLVPSANPTKAQDKKVSKISNQTLLPTELYAAIDL